MRDNDGWLAIHIAACEGAIDVIRSCVKLGAHHLEVQATKRGLTPLHLAAFFGHVEVLKELKKLGANLESREKDHGYTPLLFATNAGKSESVRTLLQLGANFQAMDDNKNNAFELAVCAGETNIMKILKEAGAASQITKPDSQLLHLAVRYERVAAIELLKEWGAHLESRVNGYTPLLYATYEGKIEVLKCLKRLGADVNAVNDKGYSALHIAAFFGFEDVIKLLHEWGFDIDIDCGCKNDEITPLHLAILANRGEIIKLLVKLGANIESYTHIVGGRTLGGTPLLYAALLKKIEAMKVLKELGANTYARSQDGKTPLDVDTTGCLRMLMRLEDMRGPNSKRKNGNTALMDAAEKNLAFAVEELLADRRTNVNAKNDVGETALHLASKEGNVSIVQLLLQDPRTDKHIQNQLGNTPLHVAAQHGKAEVVGLLLCLDRLYDLRFNNARKTARQLASDIEVKEEFKQIDSINALLDYWQVLVKRWEEQPQQPLRALPLDLHQQFVRYAQYAMRKKK